MTRLSGNMYYLYLVLLSGIFFSCIAVAEQQCNNSIALSKPDSIYTDHYDGTVTDSQSGLMWQKCSVGQEWNAGSMDDDGTDDVCSTALTMPYDRALESSSLANNKEQFTYADWRLPSLEEMQSLVESSCFSPSINMAIFPNTVSGFYWSSSEDSDDSNNAWNLSFTLGFEVSGTKKFYYYARLVRDD